MVTRRHRKFDADFKRESVRLADNSDKPDRRIEEELGLYQGAIRTWRKQLQADPKDAFPGRGHQKPVEEELRELRRENECLKRERDILKKAAAYFSQDAIGNSRL